MENTIELGRFHELQVVELVERGALLGAGDHNLFVPSHLLPPDVEVGHPIRAFIYADKEGAPQATTRTPAATLGEFAYLKCVSVTSAGAYLEWGIPKDLYAPPGEQDKRMVEGRHYVAVVCLDTKGERLIASTRLTKHFDYEVEHVRPGDEVDLLVHGHADAGVQVVVAGRHRGLIHRSDAYGDLPVGSKLRGVVHQVRHDNRLDIGLTRRGVDGIKDAQDIILAALQAAGGSLPLHDRSAPDEIEGALGMSKKAFKRGVGGLYKAKRIVIGDRGISLVEPPEPEEPPSES